MDIRTVLVTVLYAALIVLAGTAIWALVIVVRAARSTQRLADHLDATLIPLIAKADLTVDALNSELERVDGIVTQLEEVSENVSSTTRVASEIVNAPMDAVVGIADRARRVLSILFGRRL